MPPSIIITGNSCTKDMDIKNMHSLDLLTVRKFILMPSCMYCNNWIRIPWNLGGLWYKYCDEFNKEETQEVNDLGSFLTAMTAHSIQVAFYMTKFSFLTVFFSVCVSTAKTPCLLPCRAIFNRFCAEFMWARIKSALFALND